MRRVVITGMGIYSCIGKNQDEVKDSLFQGRSGIGIDPARKEMGYFSALTGLVERPDLKKLLDRKKRHSLAEQGEYAYMATLEAFRQAQIDEEFLLDHEVGILYGNDSSAAPVIEAIDVIRAKKNTAMVGSGSIFQSMNSTITMNLSVIFHLKGINFTISGACASGSHAIGMAYMLIKSGLQDCILCGGAQEVNPTPWVVSTDWARSPPVRTNRKRHRAPLTRDGTVWYPAEEAPAWYSKVMNQP